LIDTFFTSRKLINPYRLAQIKDIWPEAAGNAIFQSTELLEISNRKLYIRVIKPETLERIKESKKELVKAVNGIIGKRILTEIIIEENR